MKRLILIRHAKSSWAQPTMPDQDRPLNDRGKEAAKAVGAWLSEKYPNADEVLLSPAQRCRETWQAISGAGSAQVRVRVEDGLYLADEDKMLDVLKTATGECVIIIAHMPGIGALSRSLRRDPPPMHDIFNKYPTGATKVLDFRMDDWSRIQSGSGIFVDYVTPRDLI